MALSKTAVKTSETTGLPSVSRVPGTDFSSAPSPLDHILSLQRTMGNQAVGRLLRSGGLQAKLTIGEPNDVYEQEADRMADAVMRMPDSTVESSIRSLPGKGEKLSPSERSFFEPRFGADFSGVRLHSGTPAGELTTALQARAFTVGSDIVMGPGQYSPGTSEGKRLLGHELTHVVQQTNTVSRRYMSSGKADVAQDIAVAETAAGDLLPPGDCAADNQALFRKEIADYHHSRSVGSRTSQSIHPGKGAGAVVNRTSLPVIQRKDELENDLASAAGLTCPVSTEKLNHEQASLDITFDLGGSALTAEDINNIAVFVNNWRGASVSVPVRIHGYASKDGPPTVNWPLSCQRAEAVSKQMQKVQPAVVLSTGQTFPAGTPGIPAGFIDAFAHGETEEFSKTTLSPNRRVTAHVPSLPSLPAKVAKTPTARLKNGPTYTPNGTLKATATALKKSADFRMSAEFDQDPPNGVLPACGEVRQYIRWSSNDVDPARFRHEGFFTDKTYLPNTWYEDRDQPNTRYGHRRGPHSALNNAIDQYYDKAGKVSPNPASGRFYEGRDTPDTRGSAAYIASFVGTWEFRLDAIDVCNGNSVLGSDSLKIVW